MLYRFEEGNPLGICKFKEAVIAFYDMDQLNGNCFDEARISDANIPLEQILAFVETEEDIQNSNRSRVFICMDDGKEYELVMNPVNAPCVNFYDDRMGCE